MSSSCPSGSLCCFNGCINVCLEGCLQSVQSSPKHFITTSYSAPLKISRVFSRLFDFLFRSASLSADSFLETKDGFRSEEGAKRGVKKAKTATKKRGPKRKSEEYVDYEGEAKKRAPKSLTDDYYEYEDEYKEYYYDDYSSDHDEETKKSEKRVTTALLKLISLLRSRISS